MVDNTITKKRIQEHWAYSRWKYILLVIVCVVAWDLIYSMTEYRPPREKRVHVYTMSSGVNTENMTANLTQPVMDALVETEEVKFYAIEISSSSESYEAEMKFTTYIGAQEGDVFLMPTYKFYGFSHGEDALFVPLDDYIASGVIHVGDIDLETGKDVGMGGEEHVYGIPMDSLYGLIDYNVDPADMFLCIPLYSLNQDNAARTINALIEQFTAEKPDWYDEYKQRQITSGKPASMIYE